MPRLHNMVDLKLTWVPGPLDFAPNEKADSHANKLCKEIPAQVTHYPSY